MRWMKIKKFIQNWYLNMRNIKYKMILQIIKITILNFLKNKQNYRRLLIRNRSILINKQDIIILNK